MPKAPGVAALCVTLKIQLFVTPALLLLFDLAQNFRKLGLISHKRAA